MGASPPPFSSLATVLNVARFWAAPPLTPRLHHLESLGDLPDLHTPALMGSPASAFPPHISLAAPGPSPWWHGLCPRRQRAGSGADCCQTVPSSSFPVWSMCRMSPLLDWMGQWSYPFLDSDLQLLFALSPCGHDQGAQADGQYCQDPAQPHFSPRCAPPESENSF